MPSCPNLPGVVKLYCSACHTCWVEACLAEWKPCPFKGCSGTLRTTLPAALERKPATKKEARSFPLLEAAR